MMKFPIVVVALTALLGTSAFAADMAVKAPPPVPPAPSWDWNGLYLGAYWGNSISQSSGHTPPGPGFPGPGTFDINDGGWTGGGTAGLNWQFAPLWLVGVEGDFGKVGGSRLFGEFDDGQTVGSQYSWYATARGRFGYVTGPGLIYVTAGAGWVHVTDTLGPYAAPTQSATTTAGVALGGGIEVKLSRNWSAKTEYIYIDGGGDHTFVSNANAVPGTLAAFSHSFQVIKSGLNYRFDGGWDGLPFLTGTMQATNHNWNGFYVGGNAGAGSSLIQTAFVGGVGGATTPGENDVNGIGFVGGGQIGYNYMVWNKYLLGLEGDFTAFVSQQHEVDWNEFPPNVVFTEKTSWYATIRGRAGVSTGPALLYFTGGVAFVNFQDGVVPSPTTPNPVTGGVSSKTSSGWTFGGGTELALDAHWSAKLESLFIDAGTSTHQSYAPPFGPAPVQFRERFGIVRAGLNYTFN
jgi:outer membrane immunogenic protein